MDLEEEPEPFTWRDEDQRICRVIAYYYHPRLKERFGHSVLIDKDVPLEDAVSIVYKSFDLEDVVPRDIVRLVRYLSDWETIEQSYESDDIKTFGDAVGGFQDIYDFALLLEIRKAGKPWQKFELGGTTYKVHVVDVGKGEIVQTEDVSVCPKDTVSTFKEKARSWANLPKTDYMRCVLQNRETDELVEITDDDAVLKDIGHGPETKIYVDNAFEETDDCRKPFRASRLYRILEETLKHTVGIRLRLPIREVIQEYLDKEERKFLSYNLDVDGKPGECSCTHKDAGKSIYTRIPTTTSDGVSPEVGASAEMVNAYEQELEKGRNYYFKEMRQEEYDSKAIQIYVQLDARIRIKAFRKILERKVGLSLHHFLVLEYTINSEEVECTLTTLKLLFERDCYMIKLGRVVRKGEFDVKLFELHLSIWWDEAIVYMCNLVLTRGMTVHQVKHCVIDAVKNEHNRDVPLERLRLRDKSWRFPGRVYQDEERFGVDISTINYCEIFMQTLDGPEPVTSLDQMILFIKPWKPSIYEFGEISEIVIPLASEMRDLKVKLSEVSGISPENVGVAKGRGAFPEATSAWDAEKLLKWDPVGGTVLTLLPMSLKSGSMVIYRDNTEELPKLNCKQKREKEREIDMRENPMFGAFIGCE